MCIWSPSVHGSDFQGKSQFLVFGSHLPAGEAGFSVFQRFILIDVWLTTVHAVFSRSITTQDRINVLITLMQRVLTT